jgi:hypothetical protein
MAADVVLLQEASAVSEWHGPMCHGQVNQQKWGSAVMMRAGSLAASPLPGVRMGSGSALEVSILSR